MNTAAMTPEQDSDSKQVSALVLLRRKARVLALCMLFFLHARVWFLLIGVIARRKPVVSAQRAAVMSVVMANICHVLSPTRILSVEN